MPLAGYGVLAGSVIDQRAEGGTDSPHYQIRVRGGEADFRVAVNVLSQEKPAELLYAAEENFRHPVTQSLPGLPDGFTPLASQPGGMALDFIRANLFDRQQMQPSRPARQGPITTWPTSWTTSCAAPPPTQLPGCMPSGSAGAPKPGSRTRSSASCPATGFTTST